MTIAAISHAGELAAGATAFMWVASAVAFARAGKDIGSLTVNVLRMAMAGVLYCLLGTAMGRPLPLDAPAAAWGPLAASGLLGFFLGDLCLFEAYVLIGPRRSLLILALVPAISAILAMPALGETLTIRQWLAMGVTLAGVAWVILERRQADDALPHRHRVLGVILAILAAFAQAGGTVLSKIGMRCGYDPLGASHIRMLTGLAAFLVLITVLGRWGDVAAACRRRKPMLQVALGATTGPFLGVWLNLIALSLAAVGVVNTIIATNPVLILPAAILLDRERVSPRAWAGAVVAVAGVAWLVL
ncbi:MAG: DMT family transporter [Planctomycetota bacterium]|nr:DMT family transporter [Planctomycetota bacterium]